MINIERLQYFIGGVAVLIFAYLAFDIKGSGHDIPPNIQLLLSLIFGAILARGAVKSENMEAMKKKLIGRTPDKVELKAEITEVPKPTTTDAPKEVKKDGTDADKYLDR